MEALTTHVAANIFYRKIGSGPAVMLLHGFPASGILWEKIWGELAASFTVIVPDLPGTGESKLQGATSLVQVAESLKDLLDKEGIDQVVIAGHSMGGYIAFAFAGLYPDRVAGLSLVHSTSRADDEEKVKTRLKSIELIRRGAKTAFINQMVPNLFSDSIKQSNPLIVKQQEEESMKVGADELVNFYHAMIERKDSTYLLETAKYPLQWVIGTDDNIIYFKKILELCYKSGINFVTFYLNCGHMSMLEAPEKLNKDLAIFIRYCYFDHNRP